MHQQKASLEKVGKGEASAPVRPASRHDEFYFTDEMAVFQVCDNHIKIPASPSTYDQYCMGVYCVGRESSFPRSPALLGRELSRLQLYVFTATWS
jgi:hypothetical protein